MKILLTGGLGFIGTRFIRKFSNAHQIIVYGRKKEKTNPAKLSHLKNVTLEYCSVEDPEIINMVKKLKPDVVIHLAALSGLKKCYDNPKIAFSTNVYGTFNIINSCKKIGAKLIFCSTREVYGETLENKSKEEDPLIPNSVYGLTKMLAENLVKYSSAI